MVRVERMFCIKITVYKQCVIVIVLYGGTHFGIAKDGICAPHQNFLQCNDIFRIVKF
ncbi:protein of unknown function [Burkholderia multivorans]